MLEDTNLTIYSNQVTKHIKKKIKLGPRANVIETAKQNFTDGQFINAVSDEGIIATTETLIGNKKWEVEFKFKHTDIIDLSGIYARFDVLETRIQQQDIIIAELKLENAELRRENAEFKRENAEFKRENASLKQTVSYLVGKDVVLVAAEILLFLIKEQPKKPTSCSLFSKSLYKSIDAFLKSQTNNKIIKKIANDNYEQTDEHRMKKAFNKLANAIIKKRNSKIAHYKNLQELNYNVSELQQILSNNENLKKRYPEECFIINNYNLLMAAFA